MEHIKRKSPNFQSKNMKILEFLLFKFRVDLKSDRIVPYNAETKEKYGKPRKQKSFMDAMWEIENDPELKKVNLKGKDTSDDENQSEQSNEEEEEEEADESSEKDEDSSVESVEKAPAGKQKPKISPKSAKNNQNQAKGVQKKPNEPIKKVTTY